MVVYFCDRVENIAGKVENTGYNHPLHFPKWFQKTVW